jgi:hypothetical protein
LIGFGRSKSGTFCLRVVVRVQISVLAEERGKKLSSLCGLAPLESPVACLMYTTFFYHSLSPEFMSVQTD